MQLKKIAFTLLIGAAAAMTVSSPSFAAKKKAKAEAPQPMINCFQQGTVRTEGINRILGGGDAPPFH